MRLSTRGCEGGFVTRYLGVLGALFIASVWLLSEKEEEKFKENYKGTLRELWVRARVNWETAREILVVFSQDIAARLLAVFGDFGPVRSMRFAAASIFLGCVAFAISSLLSVLAGSSNTINDMLALSKVVMEVVLLMFYLRTHKMRLFIAFLVLCTFEIATPQYGGMTIGGVDLLLVNLSFFVPPYLLSLMYVPLSRSILSLAKRSSWAPAIVPTIACVPFIAVCAIFVWLLDGIETRSSPYLPRELYGAVAAANGLFYLAVASIVNTVVLWRALKAVAWNLASRTLHSLHDKGPTGKTLYWFGILLVGASLAGDPIAWLLKEVGLPEPPAFVEPKAQ